MKDAPNVRTRTLLEVLETEGLFSTVSLEEAAHWFGVGRDFIFNQLRARKDTPFPVIIAESGNANPDLPYSRPQRYRVSVFQYVVALTELSPERLAGMSAADIVALARPKAKAA